jgi:hypothetical protein
MGEGSGFEDAKQIRSVLKFGFASGALHAKKCPEMLAADRDGLRPSLIANARRFRNANVA